MKIAVGCDHRGLTLKQVLCNLLAELGHEHDDLGCSDATPVDYPDVAEKVAAGVATGRYHQGILICSTGIGMCIAANKVRGARAALCSSVLAAQRAREHNDANILCLGADLIEQGLAKEIVKTYVSTSFEGGRHARRLQKVEDLERRQCG